MTTLEFALWATAVLAFVWLLARIIFKAHYAAKRQHVNDVMNDLTNHEGS